MQKYLIGIIIILIIIIIYIHNYNYYINNYKSHSIPLKKSINNNFCSAKSSCTAKDPVNDPKYNMKQVIIQTLLLEEHLADKNKYCKPCIVKHFLLNIGYLIEAKWMACEEINNYPLLEDSIDYYNNLFNNWLNNYDNNKIILETLTKLRKRRQQLIEIYFFNNLKKN
jgi:hypothetical protein